MQRNAPENTHKRLKFSINDHLDILTEILKRLDGRSLAAAAAVCRQWHAIADSLWEHLCFRSPSLSSVRSVVIALGGYKRLYMLCVRPALSRLGRSRVWTPAEVQLSLSLFCVDYYERSGGGRAGNASAAPSLRFLCNCDPVNV